MINLNSSVINREGLVSGKKKTCDVIILSPSTFKEVVACLIDFSQCFFNYLSTELIHEQKQ